MRVKSAPKARAVATKARKAPVRAKRPQPAIARRPQPVTARKAAAAKPAARPVATLPSNVRKLPRARGEEIRPGFTPYEMKRGEEYMSPKMIEHFRKILLDWKRELMEEVDRTVHHMQDEVANFPDPNDRATLEEEFALELRTRDRERKLIKKIDDALAKLSAGDYGYCEVCGVEIGLRRMEARPTATLCIDCKTLDEIKERQYG
jgi:DnaK suppressor protein